MELEINGMYTLNNPAMVRLAIEKLGKKATCKAIGADCENDVCVEMVKACVDAIEDDREVSLEFHEDGSFDVAYDDGKEVDSSNENEGVEDRHLHKDCICCQHSEINDSNSVEDLDDADFQRELANETQESDHLNELIEGKPKTILEKIKEIF